MVSNVPSIEGHQTHPKGDLLRQLPFCHGSHIKYFDTSNLGPAILFILGLYTLPNVLYILCLNATSTEAYMDS